jgi:ankyrin repeat protein
LLNRGADFNLKDNSGSTALMWAAAQGYEETVKLLIQSGADINQKNQGGYTALMLAEFNGYKSVVQQLRNANAQE